MGLDKFKTWPSKKIQLRASLRLKNLNQIVESPVVIVKHKKSIKQSRTNSFESAVDDLNQTISDENKLSTIEENKVSI